MARKRPDIRDSVALLVDQAGLARGQVGTVVEILDETAVLVEFTDTDGRAHSVAPCASSELLVLRYAPVVADRPRQRDSDLLSTLF